MYVDAEARKRELEAQNEMEGGVLFKMKRDPRITRVGRLIRKASIDELPQLWNVLLGDMSLVGPRPAIPSEVAHYSPFERCRLSVKPGITCLWQVSGRSDLPFNQQVQLDVAYARRPTLLNDIGILLRTIPAVLFGRGAY
jgi:lipopolysaccharide/colanic/teichoic acid biosynthesis glycosyltransferase